MTSNINGNALTLEEKVLRKFQSGYADLEDATEGQIKARFDRVSNVQLLEMISEALEEMFEPIGHGK